MPLFCGFLIRHPHFHVERQWDTERVCQRYSQILELVRDYNLNVEVTVAVERHPVGDVGNELGSRELSLGAFVWLDVLGLSRPADEMFRFFFVYSVADSGGGAVVPA